MERRDDRQWRNITVRMPADRAADLEQAAERAHRSMSAEIMWRLDEYERMASREREAREGRHA